MNTRVYYRWLFRIEEDQPITTYLEASAKMEDNVPRRYLFEMDRVVSDERVKKLLKQQVGEFKDKRIRLISVDRPNVDITLLLEAILQL